MSQRVSSSSSSSAAAAAAAASSRQRAKAQVLRSPAGKRKREVASSSSSAALNAPSEPTAKRSRKRESEPAPAGANARRKNLASDKEAAAAASATTSQRAPVKKSPAKKASLKVPKSKAKSPKTTTKPMEIVSCGICFEEAYDHAGILDCCKHAYCFDCIVKWSDSSNTCPQCKRRIKRIAKTETATGKKVNTKYIKKRDLNSSQQAAGVIHFGPGFALDHTRTCFCSMDS